MRKAATILVGGACLALCTTAVIAQQELTAVEVKASIIGNTLTGYTERGLNVDVYYGPDGTMSGRVQRGDGNHYYDGGRWNLADDGKMCRQWTTWRDGKMDCFRYYRVGDDQVRSKAIDQDYTFDFQIRKGDVLRMKGQ